MWEVQTAKGCAWRAVYLRVNGRQVAHIGVDPNNGVTPQAFGGVGSRSFRFMLPRLSWRMNAGPTYTRLYRLSSAFWHKVDGRYGWGTKGYTK